MIFPSGWWSFRQILVMKTLLVGSGFFGGDC